MPASPPPEPVAVVPTIAPPALQVVTLDNGIRAVITPSTRPHTATVQLGIFAGTTFVAPGAAELAAQVLVDGADPSEGRPPLAQAIERLGGTLHVEPGLQTIWIDIRVPDDRWREAAAALRDALVAPTRSRRQIERVRDALVAQRIATIQREPVLALARLLLLGETSGAGHVLGLLDRDPGEVGLLQSRLYRPDRMVLGLETRTPAAEVEQAIGRAGALAFGAWVPPPPLPGTLAVLERPFEPGVWWAPSKSPAGATERCRVGLLVGLPGFSHPDPAPAHLLHSCFTLDGVGGRLERAQRDRGLAHVRWTSQVVTAGEAAALLLTADVAPADVPATWRAAEDARDSLRSAPPTETELQLALRRLPLLARLDSLGDAGRLRNAALHTLAGRQWDAMQRRAAEVARMPATGLMVTADTFFALPFAMVVVGGRIPDGFTAARRCELLPVGRDEPATASAPADTAAPSPSTWLTRAADAVGDSATLRRLAGWRYSAAITTDRSPAMAETAEWAVDGTLTRTRELLGRRIETKLAETSWSERLGATLRSLDVGEARLLQREQHRHPLALLAAHANGSLAFRTIAQRDADDRTVVVLEAVGDRFDRLRLHVDTQSFLVRVVETWETLADGTVVQIADTWSDYRTVAGLRVPFHRSCTRDDGLSRVETVFASWEPRFNP